MFNIEHPTFIEAIDLDPGLTNPAEIKPYRVDRLGYYIAVDGEIFRPLTLGDDGRFMYLAPDIVSIRRHHRDKM